MYAIIVRACFRPLSPAERPEGGKAPAFRATVASDALSPVTGTVATADSIPEVLRAVADKIETTAALHTAIAEQEMDDD